MIENIIIAVVSAALGGAIVYILIDQKVIK
jgi:hypothetical protein